MRQTNKLNMATRAIFCAILLIFALASPTYAEVTGLILKATAEGTRLNENAIIQLEAQWSGDSGPYTAVFKYPNGNTILNDGNLNETSSKCQATALESGDSGANINFSVNVSDSAGAMVTATSDKSFVLDFDNPDINTSIINGSNFPPDGTVRIQIRSNEEISAPTVTCNGKTASQEGSLTTGASFVYTLQLNGFANGVYTVEVKGKDLTFPMVHAHETTSRASFSVGSSVAGDTTITSTSFPSPTKQTAITINGTCPDGTKTISLEDNGGALITDLGVTGGNTWSITVNLPEGNHSFVAISKDENAQVVSQSAPYPFVVDTTAPNVPALNTDLPASTNVTPLHVSVLCDETDPSLPITVQAYVNGVAVGTPSQVNSGAAVMNIPLSPGENKITFSSKDKAGNESAQSEAKIVSYDSNSDFSATFALESPVSLPFPIGENYQFGAGPYKIKVTFNKAMNTSLRPTMEIACQGGQTITSRTGDWQEGGRVFIQSFSIPEGGTGYDGGVTGITVAGGMDIHGNPMNDPVSYDGGNTPFFIDCTEPDSGFSDMNDVYLSAENTTVTLGGDVHDEGSGIAKLQFIYVPVAAEGGAGDGAPVEVDIPMLPDAQTWTYSWNTAELAEGKYKLYTSATDLAKPSNKEEISYKQPKIVIIDKTAPTIGIVSANYNAQDLKDVTTPFTTAVTRIQAIVTETGGSQIDPTGSVIELVGPSGPITGEKLLNGSNLVFNFSPLPDGTYEVKITPKDKAGNTGELVTRNFSVSVNTDPITSKLVFSASNTVSLTTPSLAENQVWVTCEDENINLSVYNVKVLFNNSDSYNGQPVSFQRYDEVNKRHTLDLFPNSGGLLDDQSRDGNYKIVVSNAAGTTIAEMPFALDTKAPVISSTEPEDVVQSTEDIWLRKGQRTLKLTLSDLPSDIAKYASKMPESWYGPVNVVNSTDPVWNTQGGSGINLELSDVMMTSGGTPVPNAVRRSGNTFVVDLSAIPQPENPTEGETPQENPGEGAPEEGFKKISVDITSVDMVGNEAEATFNFRLDDQPPVAEQPTKPTQNSIFTKNVMPLEFKAKETGKDGSLQVNSAVYSFDKVNWFPLDITPAREVTINANIDISKLNDGIHTIYVKVTDRAGNESEVQSTGFKIRRTPPAVPTVTYPFGNALVNTNNQIFRWNPLEDANNYLIQIADDAGFGNIVNDESQYNRYGLKGQITGTENIAIQLPKDGVYYWRLAAITNGSDGNLVSGWSAPMVLTLDTLRPKILSISPSPCSSNTISNGQVTFTIVFSEPMNGSVNVSAQLTTAGGQVMTIERELFESNTWTGTTVIPKGNSSLYDGNAMITVTGGADLAGNRMREDNTRSVIINTGPAFDTKLFSNPANAYEIMILTKASESLNAPPTCSVEQNGVNTPVHMNFLRQRFYAGSYKIDAANPGKAYIYFSGTDLSGQVGQGYVQFNIANIAASERSEIVGKNASLRAAANSAKEGSAVYMLDRETLESPFDEKERINGSVKARMGLRNSRAAVVNVKELTPVMGLEEIGPTSLKLKKCMLYEGLANHDKALSEDKIHLYRQDSNGQWVFQGGKLENGKIKAQLTGAGRLALMADTKAPTVRSFFPADLDVVDHKQVAFSGEFRDGGSGIVKDSFVIELDGHKLPAVSLDDEGKFSCKMRYPISKGKHEIKYSVQDRAGNVLSNSSSIRASAFELKEFTPWPSPARGNKINFRYKFGFTPDAVKVRIYDTAGHVVADISDGFTSDEGDVKYDLRNKKGKRIANGVYFYKVKAAKEGWATLKKTGKFAVLR